MLVVVVVAMGPVSFEALGASVGGASVGSAVVKSKSSSSSKVSLLQLLPLVQLDLITTKRCPLWSVWGTFVRHMVLRPSLDSQTTSIQ